MPLSHASDRISDLASRFCEEGTMLVGSSASAKSTLGGRGTEKEQNRFGVICPNVQIEEYK